MLTQLTGEEDEAGLVGLQALNVDGERFVGEVLAAGVNGDADRGCELAGDSSFLYDVKTLSPACL